MGLAKLVVQSFEIPFGEADWAHDWRWMPDVRNACQHPKVFTGHYTWRSSIVTIKKESLCTHVVISGDLNWNMTLKIWSSHVQFASWRNKPLPLLPCTLCPGQLDPSSEFMWILLGHSLDRCTSWPWMCTPNGLNQLQTVVDYSRQNYVIHLWPLSTLVNRMTGVAQTAHANRIMSMSISVKAYIVA